MKFEHFYCNAKPDIDVFRALDRESRPRGIPVFLQDDPSGFVAQLFIGSQWIRFPWLSDDASLQSPGLTCLALNAEGTIDKVEERLQQAG
ncbi:MAG: hypothetical protein AAF581_17440, partial [Planctomycetota bacterium]